MQIPCVYLPGPAPAVTVANNYSTSLHSVHAAFVIVILPLCCSSGCTVPRQNVRRNKTYGEKTTGDKTAGDVKSVRQNVQRDKTSGRPNVHGEKTSGGTKRLETKDPFGLFSVHTY